MSSDSDVANMLIDYIEYSGSDYTVEWYHVNGSRVDFEVVSGCRNYRETHKINLLSLLAFVYSKVKQ